MTGIDDEEADREQQAAEGRGGVGRRRIPAPALALEAGEHPAGHQLPDPRDRRIEGRGGMGVRPVEADAERQDQQRGNEQPRAFPVARGELQQRRPHEAELAENRDAPQVGEDAGVTAGPRTPRQEIGGEGSAGGDLLAELAVLAGEQEEPAEDEDREQHREQRRQHAADAPAVEIWQVEDAALEIRQDRQRDQVARNDEKDVDAEIAAAQPPRRSIECQHRNDRDGPQAVDVGAMGRCLLHVSTGSGYFEALRKSSIRGCQIGAPRWMEMKRVNSDTYLILRSCA